MWVTGLNPARRWSPSHALVLHLLRLEASNTELNYWNSKDSLSKLERNQVKNGDILVLTTKNKESLGVFPDDCPVHGFFCRKRTFVTVLRQSLTPHKTLRSWFDCIAPRLVWVDVNVCLFGMDLSVVRTHQHNVVASWFSHPVEKHTWIHTVPACLSSKKSSRFQSVATNYWSI